MSEPSNERTAVLQMISEGQITVEEGARLLSSLGSRHAQPQAASQPDVQEPMPSVEPRAANGQARWFRVRVSDINSGRTRVMVNLPFALVRWGLRIGAQYSEEVNEINLQELADILEQGYQGKIVDVLDEEDGEHVEIFVE